MSDERKEFDIRSYPQPGRGKCQTKDKELTNEMNEMIETYMSEQNRELVGGKVIIIGNAAVGKTALFMRFLKGEYSDQYKATIGLDFSQKCFNVYGIKYQIQIFDTAGEERFQAISEHYYRSADAVMVCFDLNDQETLGRCENWVKEVEKHNEEHVMKFLVGCKSDLLHVCEYGDIESMCDTLGAEYFETSALSNKNVNETFQRVGFCVFEKILKTFSENAKNKGKEETSFTISSKNGKEKKGKGKGKGCNCN